MIEIHEVPTCVQYVTSAIYYTFTNGIKNAGVTLSKVVFFELNERLETGFIGIRRKLKVSTSILASKPTRTDRIIIGSETYEFMDPIYRRNPAFVDYFEAELKQVQK